MTILNLKDTAVIVNNHTGRSVYIMTSCNLRGGELISLGKQLDGGFHSNNVAYKVTYSKRVLKKAMQDFVPFFNAADYDIKEYD